MSKVGDSDRRCSKDDYSNEKCYEEEDENNYQEQDDDQYSSAGDNVSDDGESKMVVCPLCDKSWCVPISSTPVICDACSESKSNSQCGGMLSFLVEAASESEFVETDIPLNDVHISLNDVPRNSGLMPPKSFSTDTNRYYVSTSVVRGDFDKSRAKYYSLLLQPRTETPDGL